jgi:hypothetical protein
MSDIIEAAEQAVAAYDRAVQAGYTTDSLHPLVEAMSELRMALRLEPDWDALENESTGRIVVTLQKLAKQIDYPLSRTPSSRRYVRSAFLQEAARRLNDYRQKERRWEQRGQ